MSNRTNNSLANGSRTIQKGQIAAAILPNGSVSQELPLTRPGTMRLEIADSGHFSNAEASRG
jgi:hypothetical protein